MLKCPGVSIIIYFEIGLLHCGSLYSHHPLAFTQTLQSHGSKWGLYPFWSFATDTNANTNTLCEQAIKQQNAKLPSLVLSWIKCVIHYF